MRRAKRNLQHTKQFFFHYIFQDRNNLDRGVTLRKAAYRKGLFHLMNETINPGKHKQTADFVNTIYLKKNLKIPSQLKIREININQSPRN